MSTLIAYFPALHQATVKLLERRRAEVSGVRVFGDDLLDQFMPFNRREIRQVSPGLMAEIIGRSGLVNCPVQVLTIEEAIRLNGQSIVTPTEVISRKVMETYLPDSPVEYDGFWLRHDEGSVKSLQPVQYDRVSTDPFDRHMMRIAYDEGNTSGCWWRQVGGVVVQHDQIVCQAHNGHVPAEQLALIEGDPRDFFAAGEMNHLATSMHAEPQLLGIIIRERIDMRGASVYMSCFPCPACAQFLAHTGMAQLYFGSGCASFEGERVLKSKGVEIIYVSPA